MIRVNEEFLEAYVVELVEYGLPLRVANCLERKLGPRIKHLEGVTEDRLRTLPNVGTKAVEQVQRSLRLMYEAYMAVEAIKPTVDRIWL